MKQAHDEILEKWLDDQLKSIPVITDSHYQIGYKDGLTIVKYKLEELWRENPEECTWNGHEYVGRDS